MVIVIPEKLKTLMKTDNAFNEAATLAISMVKKFYSDNEVFELCGTTAGVISQIDNMVSGLAKPVKVKPLVWEENWAGTPTTYAAGHKVFAVERTFRRIGAESVYYIAGMPIDEIFETEEEAKQAAQEHYEKLILESIE